MAKILVVDDLAANRELVVELIVHRGYQPLEAADGAEALALVRAEHPDLVFSDILMPTMDGYEFVRQLRADPALAATEVIFYSAHYRERQARNLAKACGVSRVLIKPAEPEDILRAIDQALAHTPEPPAAPPDAREFDREHLRLMSDKLAEQVEHLQAANRRLTALTDLNLHLASERDPQVMLNQVCRDARELIGAKYAVLGVNGTNGGAAAFFTSGIDAAFLGKLEQSTIDQGLLGQVRAERRARRLRRLDGDARSIGLPPGYPPLHSCLMVPVVSLSHAYGWLCLVDKLGAEEFSEEDERLLTILAAQVGRIYENSSLYAEVRQHSEQLRDEIAERKRIAESLYASEAGLHRAQTMARLTHAITGPDGVFESWPATMQSMIGVDPGQTIRSVRDWLGLVHPDDRAWFRGKAVEAAIQQKRIDFEYRLRGPGGTWLHMRQVTEPLLGMADPDGQTHWFNTIQDISGQKQAERDQRAVHQLLHNVVENIPTAVLLKSVKDDFRILLWNKAAEQVFGVLQHDAIGRTVHDLWPAADAEDIHASDRRLATTGIMQDFPDWPAVTKNRGPIRVHMRKVALSDAGGTVTHVLAIAEDITGRKQAEAKVFRLNRVYAVLSGINSAIVHIDTRGELFREVCRIAVSEGGFMVARVIELDANARAHLAATSEANPEPYQRLIGEYNSDPAHDKSLLAVALRSGQPQVSNDVAADLRIPDRVALTKAGSYALALLPLKVEQRVAGVIVLRAREAGMFDEEELRLLLELTGNLSFALDHIAKETRLKQLAAERERSEEAIRRFAAAMDAIEDAIYLVDRSSMQFVYVNDTACRMRGQTLEQLMALGPAGVLSTSRRELERTYDTIVAGGKPAEPVTVQRTREDGSQVWLELRRHAQRSRDGWMILTLVRDITGLKKAEGRIVQLNRVRAMLSGISSLIVRGRDRAELLREACQIAVQAGGFPMAWIALVDRNLMQIVPLASAGANTEFVLDLKARFVPSKGELLGNSATAQVIRAKKLLVIKDVRSIQNSIVKKWYAESSIQSLAILPLIVADEAVGALALYACESDFFHESELKLLTELAGDIAFSIDHLDKQDRLNYLASYDVLTGLANRSLFQKRVAQYVRDAARNGSKLAVFLIDLERFKNINDSLGQPAGDALLRQVAEWITRTSSDANLVARVGGNHFAVVLPEIKQDGGVARLLDKTVKAFMEYPFRLGASVLRVAAKTGVALFPDDGTDADTLFRHAEAALKQAKASGDRYLFFNPSMTAAIAGKLTLEYQLRQALDNGEFVLHYQPKVNLVSGKMISAEALIRWNDPRTGLVPPGRFIPLLEEIGLINDVGRWALRQAITDYLRWRAAGLMVVRLAVNVSPLQLRNRGFVAEVERAISVDAHAAGGLELEITESLIMENVQHSIASLQAIRAMGVTTAIDDFGTGFSSLSYLAKLPVDSLKIDRSFVIDMTAGPQGLSLVSTIINLAHSLKLKVVAEGVETEEQLHALRLLNCDEIQGFLFSKPVPGEVFEQKFLLPASTG